MSSEIDKPSYLVHPGYRLNLASNGLDVNGPGIYQDTIINNAKGHEWVDRILGRWVSYEIGKRVISGDVPVETLDIGGGSDSTAAIGFKKRFGKAISIANLDLVLREDLDPQGVELLLGSADAIPLPDASRKVIYSTFAFMWMRREMQEGALREIARVLKPGGRAHV
jgi:SAM-dependent methyltransferase